MGNDFACSARGIREAGKRIYPRSLMSKITVEQASQANHRIIKAHRRRVFKPIEPLYQTLLILMCVNDSE